MLPFDQDAFSSSLLARLTPALLLLGLAWTIASPAQAQHPTAVTSILNGESTPDTTLEVNHNGSLLAPGETSTTSAAVDSIPAEGTGTRLMWFPAKAAFRAGGVGVFSGNGDVWNADSIGYHSIAMGRDTKAIGGRAVAMGDRVNATGTASVAMGRSTTADGLVAVAIGDGATASADKAVALGNGTTASEDGATAMGIGTEASNFGATAMGDGTVASGANATAMGWNTTAATDHSLTIGTYNDKNRGNDDSDPTTGPLFVVGNGSSSTPSDALVLDQSGNLEVTGSFVLPDGTVLDESGDLEGLPTNSNGAFDLTNNDGVVAPGTFNSGSIPTSGSGTRMMWYPAKAAFRAGRVGRNKNGTQWDAGKVGDYSVAFGVDTKASGFIATAMGEETTASSNRATAMGQNTTASASEATAMGDETTASADHATAMGLNTTASASEATAMGRRTEAATSRSLSIGQCTDENRSADNTLFVVGNGASPSGGCDSRSDALVLDKSGNISVDGVFEAGPTNSTFAGQFEGTANGDAFNDPSKHVALVENRADNTTDDETSANVLALQGGPTGDPGTAVNYISFYDGDGDSRGAIQGNGTNTSGGIELKSSGSDYAEELPVAEGTSVPGETDLVGVRGGEISLDTEGAERVMIASRAPAVRGNATVATKSDDTRRVAVAFIGQVPARVRGSVDVGDLIVASGKDDGTARAVAPREYRRSKHGPIAGQAWSSKTSEEIGEVTVAVGLGRSGAVAKRLQAQQSQIETLKTENEAIKERLAALEAKISTDDPAVASLAGPWTLALLLGLGLGGLGAGLLYRRRE